MRDDNSISKHEPYRKLVLEVFGQFNDEKANENLLLLWSSDKKMIEGILVEALTAREIQIVKMHCGIEGKALSCQKIGQKIQNLNDGGVVSRARIAKILNKAYGKLRHSKYSKKLKWLFRGYLEDHARRFLDLHQRVSAIESSLAEGCKKTQCEECERR